MNIWNTLEMTCAAMGFKYEEYKDLHTKSAEKGAILSENGYSLVNQIFDGSYTEYCEQCDTAPYKVEPGEFENE